MAVSQFIGFNIVGNLKESGSSESDRGIINNLGGGAIANDLLTFYNNLRNISSLVVGAGDIIGNTIIKPSADFVYTSGTEVIVGVNTYYVKDSDGKTTFKLSALSDLSTTVSSPPTGVYNRSDAVTALNVIGLAVDRERVLQDINASKIINTISSLSSEQLYKIYTSIIEMLNVSSISYPSTVGAYLDQINSFMDLYELRSSKSILRNADFTTSYDSSFSGVIQVVDTGNLNDVSLSPTSNPGLFILNPKSGTYARAFSSNENVWIENNANLVVQATDITVGELSFTGSNGLDFLTKGSAILVQSISPSANLTFTHYVDISIDGEDFSLCLIT
jgi:hypothetical protein